MNRTAIHEAGHFLMFLKEAIKCTTPLKKGTYYWTYDKFCEQHIVQLSIQPNIKESKDNTLKKHPFYFENRFYQNLFYLL